MKTNIKDQQSGKITLEVEVDAAAFDEAIFKAYKKIAGQVSIPGFRKGRVPRPIIENYVGKDALYAEAIDALVPETYSKALIETKIEPIDQPNVDIGEYEEGKPFVFTAEIPVKPDVELGEYNGVEVEHEAHEVTDKDVDNYLGVMQQRYAQLESKNDKELENGDTAVINFEGFLDGEPFEGGKAENHNLVLGSKAFVPGFEEQLVGLKAGDEKEIDITFPQDYQSEQLAGKEVVFKVKINEVKVKKLLPLDDEFAKDISEFETLEELKQDTKKKLLEQYEQENKYQTRNKVIEKVVEKCEVDIPQVLIDRKAESFINEMGYQLAQQGITIEKYLEMTNTTIEQLREHHSGNAKKAVKNDLVLEAIAKAEQIQVTEDEAEAQIEKIAKESDKKPEEVKSVLAMQGQLGAFMDNMKIDKTIDLLVDNAKIVKPKEQTDENIKQNEEQ